MPLTTEELVDKYLITEADRGGHPYYPTVPIWNNSWITPQIDGVEYFTDLRTKIDLLSGPVEKQGIYLSNWVLGYDFVFRGEPLIEILRRKALEGADVRVLIWVNDFALSTRLAMVKPLPLTVADISQLIPQLPQLNTQLVNLTSIRMLRLASELENRVIANTLDHPLGASHAKLAVVFDETNAAGYTGGIDFWPNRESENFHDGSNAWHDVMARVEGDAVQALFDFFRSLWNELAARSADPQGSPQFFVGSELVPAAPRAATLIPGDITMPPNPATTGSSSLMRVQSLRTIPSQRDAWWAGPERDFPSASDGVFEVQLALKKAIQNAETYIYVEDQAFESRELYGYLLAALQAKPQLKVIMLTGQADPADPPQENRTLVLKQYLTDGLTVDQMSRVVFFKHTLATVHSKLWVIDDNFALIGSANFLNRSLFTDIEHSVSFVHSGAVNQVRELRVNLWGEHFRLPAPPGAAERAELYNVDVALNIWNPAWVLPSGTAVPSFMLPHYADSADKFKNITWDSHRVPSLSPYGLLWRDAAGNPEIVTEGGKQLQVLRDAAGLRVLVDPTNAALVRTEARPAGTITAAGADFIDDLSLPAELTSSTTASPLMDEWVEVSSGPNTGTYRRITGHIGHRISFATMPMANPADVQYLLYRRVLKGFPLPPSVRVGSFLSPLYNSLSDRGELP